MSAGTEANRRLRAIRDHTVPLPGEVDGLVLVLPRGDRVSANATTNTKGTVTHLRLNKIHFLDYYIHSDISLPLELSAIGTPYEGATEHIPRSNLFDLSSPDGIQKDISIAEMWTAIYTLFTLYRTQEHILVRLTLISNAKDLTQYLLISGLGRKPQGTKIPDNAVNLILLSRAAFWQAAGTTGYHSQGWLLTPTPTFPSVPAFTRTDLVIASHPLRPPKPHGGEVLYRRYCSPIGKSFELVAFDIGDPEQGTGPSPHMAAFHKWHNDERVNNAWGERGTLEAHTRYIEGLLADPAVVPVIMRWDGDLMGYAEFVWAKENHVAQHYPGDLPVGEWERGMHVLVGENKFLGGSEIWLRSLVHYLFLAEFRTNRIVGEPKKSNVPMIKSAQGAGYHYQSTIDFPYKRSALLLSTRDRFFSDSDRLY